MTLTATLLAVAIAPSSLEAVKLKLNVGDKLTYKSVMVNESDGMDSPVKTTMTTVETFEVTGTREGWTELKSTIKEFDVKFEGDMVHEAPDYSQKGLTVTYEVGPTRSMRNFKVVDYGAVAVEMRDFILSKGKADKSGEAPAMQEFGLPDTDLSVGTTWERKAGLPSFTGPDGEATSTGEIKLAFKVVAFEGEGKDRAMVVEGTRKGKYTISFGGGEMSGSADGRMKYWIRVSDGVILKMESSNDEKMSSGFGDFGSKHKQTLELVKPS
jgi:hypothetical protein